MQNALADSLIETLDWAVVQSGKLGLRGGHLLFATAEQQAEIQALLAKVNVADLANANATKDALAVFDEAARANEADMQVAKELAR